MKSLTHLHSKTLQCLGQTVLLDFHEAGVNPFYCQAKMTSPKTNLCYIYEIVLQFFSIMCCM